MRNWKVFLCSLFVVFALVAGANAEPFAYNDTLTFNKYFDSKSKDFNYSHTGIPVSPPADYFTGELILTFCDETVDYSGVIFKTYYDESIIINYEGGSFKIGNVNSGEYPITINDLGVFADGSFDVTIHPDKIYGGSWLFGLNAQGFTFVSSTLNITGDDGVQVAVPEPGMLIFLGAGLAGLLAANRKRPMK